MIAGTDYHIAVGAWSPPGYPLEGGQVEFSLDLNTFHLSSPPWGMRAVVPEQITCALGPIIPELHGHVRDVHFFLRGLDFFRPELLGFVTDPSQSLVHNFIQPGDYNIFAVATNDAGEVLQTADTLIRIRPVNDNFGNRIPVTGANLTITGLVAGATFQPGEPIPYAYESGSAWWSWTAPATGRYLFLGTDFSFQIYTGASIGSLVLTSHAPVLNAQAGVAYQIQIISADVGYLASLELLRIMRVFPPLNDHFTNRTLLAGSYQDFSVPFVDASREPNEPSFPGEEQYVTLWWRCPPSVIHLRFTAPRSPRRVNRASRASILLEPSAFGGHGPLLSRRTHC